MEFIFPARPASFTKSFSGSFSSEWKARLGRAFSVFKVGVSWRGLAGSRPLRLSAVPPGLGLEHASNPALKRWAKIGRPSGTGPVRQVTAGLTTRES